MKESIFDKFYIPYSWKNIYYSIRDFFNPRQKWLTSKIPNSWCDKTWLLQLFAFESIVHFIEEEQAFDNIEWNGTKEHAEAGIAFERAYKYVKIKIPLLEKQLEKLDKDPDLNDYYQNHFMVPVEDSPSLVGGRRYKIGDPPPKAKTVIEERQKINTEIEWMTQEVVEIVAKYRNFMWT